jgi:hypothetical protein
MSTLYQIAAEYRASLEALAELDLDAQTIADTVEGMQGELQDKLRAVIAYALSEQAEAVKQAAAATRMSERAKATANRAEGLLNYARDAMQATGLSEVRTDEWGAKLAKKPPSVSVTDPALLPAWFFHPVKPQEPQPDKAAIAAELKAGREVPGAVLTHGYRLAIK